MRQFQFAFPGPDKLFFQAAHELDSMFDQDGLFAKDSLKTQVFQNCFLLHLVLADGAINFGSRSGLEGRERVTNQVG